MLNLVDESIESFLRATVPLSAVDIDVSFEPPTEEFIANLDAIIEAGQHYPERAHLMMHRGNHLRHLGRTDEARRCHEQAIQTARSVQRVNKADAEELEIELRNTALDFFEGEDSLRWLQERVAAGDFASVRVPGLKSYDTRRMGRTDFTFLRRG